MRVTERGWYNDAVMDKGATHALVSRSNPSQPPQTYLADANGKRLAWVEQNALDAAHPYAPYLDSHRVPTFGSLNAPDGSKLYYRMLTPKLEPGKRYPVFFDLTAARTASRSRTNGTSRCRSMRHSSTAAGSYSRSTIAAPTAADEIRECNLSRHGRCRGQGPARRRRMAQEAAVRRPREIAVMGWSYGGYMTLKRSRKRPGVLCRRRAVAPVTRWELYDTAYTERYLGNPSVDSKPYQTSNALDDAVKIRDPLLLVHGMSDDNVVFQNSTELYARLQQAKRPFEMMVYPGATHAVAGEGPQTHVWTTIMRFFGQKVLGKAD